VFLVDGHDPTQRPAVRDWWAGQTTAGLAGTDTGTCQVSGRTGPMARMLPSISVPGSGAAALISANFPAAQRYGSEQSSAAHLTIPTAVGTHAALNWLLGDRHHRRRIGDTTYTWWLDDTNLLDFDPLNCMMEPNDADVATLLSSPWTGRPGLSDSTHFRVLAVTTNKGRHVIRYDHRSTLNQLHDSITRWLRLIERPRGLRGAPRWPTLANLAAAAVPPRRRGKDNPRHTRAVEALTITAITGTPPPPWLLAALVQRCRATPIPRTERGTTIDRTAVGARVAALTLCRTLTQENSMTDPHQPNAAELCGRILAQLDAIQNQALGTINRTVAERYYAGASTQPRSVITPLLATAQAHLSKIGRSDRGAGAKIVLARGLDELHHQLLAAGGYPSTLNVAEQADFALGFWDHRHTRFTKTDTTHETPDTTTQSEETTK